VAADETDEGDVATAEPEAPRVVTTTRRRTARRPAGAPTPREESSYDPPTGPDPDDPAPADGSQPPWQGDPLDGDADDQEGPVVPHVPVKRKGARKR
jgi:ribonuclease E